ncbi:hypothetical protein JSQ81_07585 [Sporosarcina sp. Marseille-Q4063]|uniref:hypothetical protein n=1 Tax=Sporosarcina sp. Marseille-Q4063 TaxID=2810514 RepID=UPI001BB0D0BD|nr:hypothetical protein [Sporosarcina sp. Marseille-Q4063]QUW23375.1 hypothetical protein JSQ81_07585 [Sporosarcina sp. Marseille-Q4063]
MLFVRISYLHFDIVNYTQDFPVQLKGNFEFDVQVETNELYKSLYNLIGKNKGDGFDINITETPKEIYVSITLNVYEGFHENPDYSYIISYLNSLPPILRNTRLNEVEDSREVNYLLTTEVMDEKSLEILKNELKIQKIDVVKVNHAINVTEQGAGHWWEMYLLAITSGLSIEALKTIVGRISNNLGKDVKVKAIDFNKLLINLSDVTNTNISSLEVLDITEVDSQLYILRIGSRYAVYTVKSDYKGNLIELKTDSKSQTKI